MGVIYLQQLREYFASFRVQIGLFVVLLFFLLNGVLASLRIEQMREDDALLRANIEQRYERVQTVASGASTRFRVANEPTGTEFMSEGGFNWFWGSVWMTAETGVFMGFYYARDINVWMDRFESLDWTLIVRLVLSFLCIVLAYDGIAGEAERGTLRLVLAYPISRIQVLLAKFSAQLTVLGTAFVLGSLISLVILSFGADLALTVELLGKYLLYGAAVGIYLSLFLLLSLGVSALMRSSVSALVLLTLTWAVVNIILPQSSYLAAVRTVEVPEEMRSEAGSYMSQVRWSLYNEGRGPRSPETARADDYAVERRYARLMEDAEKEGYRLGQVWLDRKVERYEVARTVNLLSPAYAFQYAVEALLGTGLPKRQHFLDQAFEYRETLRSFLRERDAGDGDSPHLLFHSEFMSQEPLDGDQMPRFVEQPLSPADGVAFSVVPFVVLLVETLASFLFALWAVNRLDVTGYAMAEDS
ncbi:MAG: ABC transporter permease subunit [Gemmatimonadetes bacterium]|jgi:ABC-type transport system involved in multi-copper enzyme maturation permease subunit|nr:ABC transporter permease subunit [Gemmatimonadota bacterium]